MFTEQDLIRHDGYEKWCDFVYDEENLDEVPRSGIIFCRTNNIDKFFKLCGGNDQDYVVVSGDSDFSLEHQQERHPNADLKRMAVYQKWDQYAAYREKYAAVQIGPACDPTRSNPFHRFSIKCDCFTRGTFDYVPSNIKKWFVANSNIEHPIITRIPFGMNGSFNPQSYKSIDKDGLLYVNFSENTQERSDLLLHYMVARWPTIAHDLPVTDYRIDLARHKFILCPAGNGIDCFRTLEALYLGAIPIMRRCRFSEDFAQGLPVLVVDSLFGLTPNFLHSKYGEICWQTTNNFDKLRSTYWRKTIEESRELLKS